MKNKKIYVFELLLLVFIGIFKFLFVDRFTEYMEIVLIIFWLSSLFITFQTIGYRSNKTLLSLNITQITIIVTMMYFLITYLSGLFLGFLRNSYSLEISNILRNTVYLIVMIVSEEYIRSMIANKCGYDKKPLIFLTILYILLDFFLIFNINSINSNLRIFIFVCNSVLPIIARNVLCSYLAYNVGIVPGLVYRLFMTIYIYIFPIYPDLGYYVSSVFGILIPYLIYIFALKALNDAKRKRLSPIKRNFWYVNIPLTIILLFVVSLVAGLFKYQIMAIGSGSMEPIIYRGDAVIFEKVKGDARSEINKGEVLVFKHSGKYITHRIVDKYTDNNGKIVYQTKGDNNSNNDNFVVDLDNVVGVVKLKVNYIGFPSLWIQDLFKK